MTSTTNRMAQRPEPGEPTSERPTARPMRATGRRRSRVFVPWVVFAIFFCAYPVILDSPFSHSLGVLIVVYALYATGWNMLGGFAGQISLGHATFFGCGAYAVALGARNDINPWLSLLAGAAASVPIALVIGWPVFRLKGHYFTIATIATGEIVYLLVLNASSLGGANGLSIGLEADGLARFQWSGRQKWEYYFLGLCLLVLALLTTRAIARSKMGYYLLAIRNDQEAASSLGVPIRRYKQFAFVYSAIVVSITGSFFAQYVLFVDPHSMLSLDVSIQITIIAVLGGVASVWGPVIGAVVFVWLTEWTRVRFGGDGNALNLVIYGTIVMLIAAFEPNGLIGVAGRVRRLAGRFRA